MDGGVEVSPFAQSEKVGAASKLTAHVLLVLASVRSGHGAIRLRCRSPAAPIHAGLPLSGCSLSKEKTGLGRVPQFESLL